MSCPPTDDGSWNRLARRGATGRPEHNWRPTVVHGAALWLLLGVAAALPLGAPVDLGVAAAGVLVVPALPVALWCDYRQARAYNDCGAGASAYVRNLARDVLSRVVDGEALGSARTRFEC